MQLVLELFFFKQKTAYEMRISDWSSDVCSSDLFLESAGPGDVVEHGVVGIQSLHAVDLGAEVAPAGCRRDRRLRGAAGQALAVDQVELQLEGDHRREAKVVEPLADPAQHVARRRSEEHTSEIQSLMRSSYAVFCLKKKKKTIRT